MKLSNNRWLRAAGWAVIWLAAAAAVGQAPSTTTVTGTVYLANGQPGAGTLVLSWPTFTTADGQLIAADSMSVTIPSNGLLSVNLVPNQGATPAGEYYTAVFYMIDGSTHRQYWMVPATPTATLAAVQSQVMPAAQAVQAVSKAYVDEAIAEALSGSTPFAGGTLTGPLYLSGDPTAPLQAADKHYVDTEFGQALPLTGGTLTGPVTATQIGAAYEADQFPGADFGAKLQACLNAINTSYGGTCDGRNFSGSLSMASNLTISTANTTVLLPCATIATAQQVIVTAGTRNVTLRGCALRGGSAASGSQGGTVFAYSGTSAMFQVGDATYAVDTPGMHLDDVVINTTSSTSASAQGLIAYRTQELDLESLYLLGNQNQTGITLDGTGNYTGGTFLDDQFDGFGTAINAIGHQVTNPATTDWLNASTFVRLHIDCPTSSGSPISGTYGINLQQGDGNTFTGGDVENCATALHLGANAQNNTFVGLRNENSTSQVVADAGSSYNDWITGGTMFTGKLTDNGTRNSFLDTFHRSFNGVNGDQYRSQVDGTIANHYYLGIGLGNVRGLTQEYTTDVPGSAGSYQNAWQWGPGDGTSGQQVWSLLDMLNNVQRFGVQQNTTAGGSPQSYLNAAGTGLVCFQCSANAGTGGVAFGSGGSSPATVATVSNAGNAQFNGTLQVGGTTQSAGTMTVRNNADAEVDYYLWPGLTASQKGSFTYKDWDGNSQWYMVKDASNNWALNSAVGGLDSLKAYQSTNSGDTYINASNSTGHIRLNYESGSGAETDIYAGSSSNLIAAFLGTTSIKFPGLAASSGTNCLQIDNSGYITNTGTVCGSGGGGSGTVNSGSTHHIAYYAATGTAVDSDSSLDDGGTTASTLTYAGSGGITASAGPITALTGLNLKGSTSGTAAITVPATAGTATITLGTNSGTPAVTASAPLSIASSTGNIACATCTTNASPLTDNAVVIGNGSNAAATISVDATVTHALFATAGAPAFRAITASDLPSGIFACTELWGGTGTANALQPGDDAIANNTCYNDSGSTRIITAVRCRSDNASNTTTVNPTFGPAGTGTTILLGALTCGSSYAYSSGGTLSNTSWTTGTGIDPAMGGTLTGTSIAMTVEYHY